LTAIYTFGCLGGQEVPHQTALREVTGSISGSGKDFMFAFVFVFFVVVSLPPCQKHIMCHEISSKQLKGTYPIQTNILCQRFCMISVYANL